MENSKKDEEKGKTGIVPNEEIKGSDADKAYDDKGDFGKETPPKEDAQNSDVPSGADADR